MNKPKRQYELSKTLLNSVNDSSALITPSSIDINKPQIPIPPHHQTIPVIKRNLNPNDQIRTVNNFRSKTTSFTQGNNNINNHQANLLSETNPISQNIEASNKSNEISISQNTNQLSSNNNIES